MSNVTYRTRDDSLAARSRQFSPGRSPFFFAHAFNDHASVLNSLLLASELKKAGGSAELHIYPDGGAAQPLAD